MDATIPLTDGGRLSVDRHGPADAPVAVVLVHGDVTLRGPAAEIGAAPAALEAAYLGHTPT